MTVPRPRRPSSGRYPDPALPPWVGGAAEARAAVTELARQWGLDLWLLTRLDGEVLTVLACAGPWADQMPPGTALSWAGSFCRAMATRHGPMVAADVLAVPAYAALADQHPGVRAYLGVPLHGRDGELFGTLCALSGDAEPEVLEQALPQVQLVGRLLISVLGFEHFTQTQSAQTAQAWAAAEIDQLTGLGNRRGWDRGILIEDQRRQRYGSHASVLVLDVDGLKGVNDAYGHGAGDQLLQRCARVLIATSRPGDGIARVGGDEFTVLALECDPLAARALLTRLQMQLRSADVAASAGVATQRVGEDLVDTWHRADAAMYRDKRRRKNQPSLALASTPPRPQPGMP